MLLLSDTCSARQRKGRGALFQPLGYQTLVPRFCVAGELDLSRKTEEFAQAEERLLNRVEDGEEKEMP